MPRREESERALRDALVRGLRSAERPAPREVLLPDPADELCALGLEPLELGDEPPDDEDPPELCDAAALDEEPPLEREAAAG